MKTQTLNVENMKCMGCSQTVKDRLQALEGVQAVDVDLNTHTAQITYDLDSLTLEALNASLQGTPYKVSEA